MTDRTCAKCEGALLANDPLALCPACQLAALGEESACTDASASGFPSIYGFRILAKIGEGGMGTVYRAERASGPTQTVAIKVLRFSGINQDDATRRFRDEMQALIKIDHPQVARFIDSGLTSDGQNYYVMEWVKGSTLHSFLAANGNTLASKTRLTLAHKICASVAACHQVGIVHRDLHPENILIDSHGEPKLLDFGISKILSPINEPSEESTTRPGAIVGHPSYLSPEQIDQTPLGPAADVFSLGLLFCEIFGGQHPFPSKSPRDFDRMSAIRDDDPILPSQKKGQPRDLSAILSKALQKEPAARYSNAGELGADLTRAIRGEPVVARRPTIRYVMARFLARNRLLVSGLLIIAGIAATSLFLDLQREAQAKQSEQIRQAEHLIERGNLSGQRGEWQAALDHYQSALAGGANPVESRFLILAASEAIGEKELSKRTLIELQEVTRNDRNHALLSYWRAQLSTGQDGIENALANLHKAVDSGHLPKLESLIAQAALEVEPLESIALLDQALVLDPFDHRALIFRSIQLLLAARPAEAVTSLETSLRLFPANESLPIYLTLVLARSGQLEKAHTIADQIEKEGDHSRSEKLRKIIAGLEVGIRYYEAAWAGNAFKKHHAYSSLVGDLKSANAEIDSSGLSSLILRDISRFSENDTEVVSFLMTNRDPGERDRKLDAILAKKPLSVIGAALLCGTELDQIIEKSDNEEVALRYCRISAQLVEASRGDQLRALTLEIAALAHFLHAQCHKRPDSFPIAMSYVQRRLEIPLPISKTPLRAMLLGAQHTDELQTQAELAKQLLALNPTNAGNILLSGQIELLQNHPAGVFSSMNELLKRDDLSPKDHKKAESLREKSRQSLQKLLETSGE